MENNGKIYSISGPVVIATDLDGKMFDVVRVGNAGLVGEVIKIVENKFTIQVYEDTSGLKPGEPVISTGKPLSVELGPGLLKSIYDGIQRPLDVIQSETGDFIVRGASAPPLDEKKEWEFNPVLKSGDDVEEGYILGTVNETDIIVHKIMVPHGIRGTIKTINPGKFKVSDTVCTIEMDGKTVEVKMKQIWPVREARKVFLKFPPEIPLITGQRVIDSFFPVAKGGTVAVPGPFGSGKCVSGDTPLLLADGSIQTIEKVYKDAASQGEIEYSDENETLIKLKSPLKIYSFYDGKVSESKSDYIYRGKSDSLLKIKTRTGKQVKITPVHKLFRLDEEGSIVETEAEYLQPGDYIVSIRKFKTEEKYKHTDIYSLFDDAHAIGNENKGKGRSGNIITVPDNLSVDLSELIGFYVAGGYIKSKNTFVITNSDEKITERAKYLLERVFNLKEEIQRDKSDNLMVNSVILTEFIRKLIPGKLPSDRDVPRIIMKSNDNVISAFLKGYYLSNGSCNKKGVELSLPGKNLSVSLSYLLTRLGIMHSREGVGNDRYSIIISDLNELEKFYLNIAHGNKKYQTIENIEKYIASRKDAYASVDMASSDIQKINDLERADTSYSKLKSSQVEIYSPNKFAQTILINSKEEVDEDVNMSKYLSDSLEFIYFDRIDSIEEITGPFDVYDVTTPNFGSNFVGGDGAILLHNTVIQHQLSKWSDADITVYVGCGERGNEMTEILSTFPELQDPKSGKPLMEKTILIANTSNMPVAAREASIYTGVTIAEYYRDMGYDVALMADSTSRWAEALREISGRLEEMPGEEGYPAYLGRRISEFYERSGNAQIIPQDKRSGSITLIGAVSPPGGDLSDPVVQNTLRVTRAFWALDASLASRRHFPSINWLNSYSLYLDSLSGWFKTNINPEWMETHSLMMGILQKESELQEIVQLVGYDSLPEKQKNVLDIAKMIREDFLQQNAFDDIDTYCSINKQYEMLMIIKTLNEMQEKAIEAGLKVTQTSTLPVRMKIARMKEIKEEDFEKFYKDVIKEINDEYNNIMEGVESV
jgi:V/A-type H+-transporting ATPase subunit A